LYFALAKNKTAHKKIGKSKFPFIKVYSSTIEETLAIHMLLSKKIYKRKRKIVDWNFVGREPLCLFNSKEKCTWLKRKSLFNASSHRKL